MSMTGAHPHSPTKAGGMWVAVMLDDHGDEWPTGRAWSNEADARQDGVDTATEWNKRRRGPRKRFSLHRWSVFGWPKVGGHPQHHAQVCGRLEKTNSYDAKLPLQFSDYEIPPMKIRIIEKIETGVYVGRLTRMQRVKMWAIRIWRKVFK